MIFEWFSCKGPPSSQLRLCFLLSSTAISLLIVLYFLFAFCWFPIRLIVPASLFYFCVVFGNWQIFSKFYTLPFWVETLFLQLRSALAEICSHAEVIKRFGGCISLLNLQKLEPNSLFHLYFGTFLQMCMNCGC